jgi:phosphate:Na+ symporter
MVFVATLNIQLIILFLLGVSGILLTQMRSSKPILGVLFGGGLMFFGLQMVGGSASSLTELQWFESLIVGVDDFAMAAFFVGAVLSMILQSPQSVAILAIALTSADVLSTWTTIAIIYGSNFGGGLSTFLLSAGFRGTARQIMVFQTLFNVLTGTVLLVLFYVEKFTGIPLVHAFVTSLGSAVAQQMAVVYLIFNVFGAIMMFVLRAPILGWIEKRWPPAPEEDIARLRYLQDHTMDTPDLALELAEKEQIRFISLLQGNLDALRMPEDQGRAASETTARAIGRLHEALEEALTELSRKVDVEGSEQMISLTNRSQLLGSLQQSMAEYGIALRHARRSSSLEQLCSVFLESLDALVGAAIEGVESNDGAELERIWNATHSRSEQMRSIRKRMLSGEQVLSNEDRLDLINLTNSLERTVWILHEYMGALMEQYPQGRPSVAYA